MKRSVLLAGAVPPRVLDRLNNEFSADYLFTVSKDKAEAVRLAQDVEVLVMFSPSDGIVSSARNCRWIHAMSTGVEGYLAMKGLRENGQILLTNSAGVFAVAIAEHVFALILAHTRRIDDALNNQRERKWIPPEYGKSNDIGELEGKIMCIVGLGHIGLAIAKRAKAFGMGVVGTRKNVGTPLRSQGLDEFVDQVFPSQKLSEAVGESDFVVNALPRANRC